MSDLKKEIDLLPLLSKKKSAAGSEQRILLCPVCGSEYNHIEPPYLKDGGDNYEAKWHGRGDLVVVPLWGECGSKWELCVGFHKGNSSVFVRLNKSCKE